MIHPARVAFHNGEIAPTGDLHVDPFGPLALWGEGIFDTFRVHQGRILYGPLHVARLLSSVESVWGLREDLRARVEETWRLVEREAQAFSSGRGRVVVAPVEASRQSFDVFAELDCWSAPSAEDYARGVSLGFSKQMHPGLGAWGKSTSALWSRTAIDEARKRSLDELILCRNEIIVETAWSAIIWREQGEDHWWTPSSSLGGLQSTTLEALRASGVEIVDVVATRERIRYAQSIVLLSSLRLAIGVNSLGERQYEALDRYAAPLREILLSAPR